MGVVSGVVISGNPINLNVSYRSPAVWVIRQGIVEAYLAFNINNNPLKQALGRVNKDTGDIQIAYRYWQNGDGTQWIRVPEWAAGKDSSNILSLPISMPIEQTFPKSKAEVQASDVNWKDNSAVSAAVEGPNNVYFSNLDNFAQAKAMPVQHLENGEMGGASNDAKTITSLPTAFDKAGDPIGVWDKQQMQDVRLQDGQVKVWGNYYDWNVEKSEWKETLLAYFNQ